MKIELKNISIDIEGTSHSESIKLFIKGIKKGTEINDEYIKDVLKRRNPGTFYNTPRKEDDEYVIKRGVKDNKVTGTIVVEFKNKRVNKSAYIEHDGFLRPSHSDYAQYLKKGYIESGAGEFSGRMTLPLTFVGAIAKSELEKMGTEICSKIESIESFKDSNISENLEEYKKLDQVLPVKDKEKAEETLKAIKEEGDTAGGIIKTVAFNVKEGLGGVLDSSLESKIASLVFGIPSVKAVEFGDGIDITKKKGSEVEDAFFMKDNKIRTKENHNGGVLGGVSTGENIIVKTAFKPIPTHKKEMTSLNVKTLKEETVVFGGNHDVLSLNRAIPCVEGMIALVLLDEIYETL